MDAKLIFFVAMVILGISSITVAKPTCPEPTCGGTRQVAAPPEGGEEEKPDPCDPNNYPIAGFLTHISWKVYCEEGTAGLGNPNPPGKIGTPSKEGGEEEEK